MKLTDLFYDLYYTVRFSLEDAVYSIKSKLTSNSDYSDISYDNVEEEVVKPRRNKKKSKKKKKS